MKGEPAAMADWLIRLAAQRRATRSRRNGGSLWVAAEKLPQMQIIHPTADMQPAIKRRRIYRHRMTRERL